VPDSLLDAGGAPSASEPDHLVCSCQVVSSGAIRGAIAEFSLTTVEGVSERTGAATGCGGCRPDVEAMLLNT
jgi:NAD(P)H-nitrite reductase large subunit